MARAADGFFDFAGAERKANPEYSGDVRSLFVSVCDILREIPFGEASGVCHPRHSGGFFHGFRDLLGVRAPTS